MKIPFEELDIGKARNWLKGYAKRVAPAGIDPDDLESEGLIAMWQAHTKTAEESSGSLDSYLIQAAKWQIGRVLERRKWTGQDKPRAPRGINSKGLVLADQVERAYPDDVLRDWVETSAPEHGYEVVDNSDIAAEVRRALDVLTPTQKDRLVKKFWLHERVPLSGGWWGDPQSGAKIKLTAMLSHLAEAV